VSTCAIALAVATAATITIEKNVFIVL